METSRTNAGRSPLGDLTNTPLEGPSVTKRPDVVPDEPKRKAGQGKKRGRDTALATDGHPPENGNANENDTYASKNVRRRERDRARRAAMSPEQRALINKKRCDQYAAKNSSKKAAKELQFSPDTTVVNNTLEAEGTNDYVHPESTSIVKEQEQLLGDGNEDSRTENSRKELRLQRDRARRAAMSPEKIALINKRRRDEYAAKNAPKKAAKQQMMLQKNSEITGISSK
ncbi:unnamed protein product [Urochloa humidicola]